MALRCPSCNKFAALSADNEPEVEMDDPTYDKETNTVNVTGNVRIVITAECCGDELKETTFDVDAAIELPKERTCECDEFEADADDAQITEELKKGKKFYGAELVLRVNCKCGQLTVTEPWTDSTPSSYMDELA